MGWFSSRDSISSLRKRGEGLKLLHLVCDETETPKERNKALQALVECDGGQVGDTLVALLERIFDYRYFNLREPFIAAFVQLFNKHRSYRPGRYIRTKHVFKELVTKLSNTRGMKADAYRDFDGFRQHDADRVVLLPLAQVVCDEEAREHLLFMAKDPNPLFRACFLEWVVASGDTTHLPIILNLTLDPFSEVRQCAFRALAIIGQPMVPDLVPFLEANAHAGADLVDFCAKIFSQPKAVLLGALIDQRCSRLGPKPDSKDIDAVCALFNQLGKVREPPAAQVALQLFNQIERAKAPEVLKAACMVLDASDEASRTRLEGLAQDYHHVCRGIAQGQLFHLKMGSAHSSGGHWDLHDLLARGLVRIEALGESITVLTVSISNLSDVDLKVRIPKGTLFLASGHWQDMVTTDGVKISLPAKDSSRFRLPVACARAGLPIPRDSNGFREVVRAKGDLAKLMDSLAEGHGLSTLALQAAVWAVTDSYSASQVQDRLVDASTGEKVITSVHLNKARQILEGAGFKGLS